MKEQAFHVHVGGRQRQDKRFVEKEPAPTIMGLIVEVRQGTGMTNRQIAEAIGVSSSTLSRAAGGRAGEVIGPDGKSTTGRVLEGLVGLAVQSGSREIDSNVGLVVKCE